MCGHVAVGSGVGVKRFDALLRGILDRRWFCIPYLGVNKYALEKLDKNMAIPGSYGEAGDFPAN